MKKRVLLFLFALLCFLLCKPAYTKALANNDRIHFLNVGQADSILIESQGEFGLVDAAKKGNNVYKYLEQVMGDKKLKFIVLTHSHTDHTGGFRDVVDRFVDSNTVIYIGEGSLGNARNDSSGTEIRLINAGIATALDKGATVYEYATELTNENKYKNITKRYIKNNGEVEITTDQNAGNNAFALNNFSIDILNRERDVNPIGNIATEDNDNKNSLIELVTHIPSGKKTLLTGDLSFDDESRFVCTADASTAGECRDSASKDLISNIDILKLAHHCLYSSNSIDFLNLTNPKDAIITQGRYEFINDVPINYVPVNYLESKNTNVYMTSYDDRNGHNFDDDEHSKKSVLVTFSNSDYTITDASSNPISRFISIEDTSNIDTSWIDIKYYDQTSRLYFDSNHQLHENMTLISENGVKNCYIFSSINSIMLKGWVEKFTRRNGEIVGKFYYFSPVDGKKLAGEQVIDGKTYNFDTSTNESGYNCSVQYGYLKYEGFLNKQGDDWYYIEKVGEDNEEDYIVYTGWKTIDGKKYYFEPTEYFFSNGLMVKGFKTLKDEEDNKTYTYYFDQNGVMQTGWIEADGNKYYADENGHLLTRVQDIDSNRYYFDPSTGAMYLGFHEIGDYTYYFNENNNSGELVKGFFKVGDNWYYSNSNSGRLRFTCFKVESLQICPDSSGVLQNFNGIVQKPDESSCSNPIYNGKSQSVVTNSKEGFTYNDNMQTNPGVYPVTASLSEGYIWNDNTVSDVTFDCSLQKGDINNSSITVANQKYTGQPLTPDVYVSMNYNNLIKNIDYTVSYSNNTNIGIGEITVNGKGNYVGSKTISFKIVEDNELNIHAIGNHLENGDATLLESNGEYLLMDTLTPNDYQILEDYLLSEGVTHLSIYISHYHNDHYGGLVNLIDSGKFNIDKVYFPKTDYMCNWKDISESAMRFYNNSIVFKKIKESNIQYEFIWPTNTSYDNHCFDIDENNYINKISVGSAIVNIIGPVSELDSSEPNINNRSLISKVVIGETKFLTAGDIETSVEDNMRESGVDLTADIMKLNHHGVSKTHNSREFTNRVNPKYAFFTRAGEGNFDSLNSLVKYVSSGSSNYPDNPNSFRGANLYSDSLNGNIVFSIKNDEITVSPEKNYNTITLNYINRINGDVIASNTYKYATGYYYHINYSTEIDGYTYVSSDEIPSDGIISENKAYSLYYNPIIISKTITFHANNGTETTSTQNFSPNENFTLTKNSFEKSGYNFVKWNTKANGTGTNYTDEQTVNFSESIDLYAQWEKIPPATGTITFHSNNGEDTTTTQSFSLNSVVKLNKNEFTKLGHYFKEWNTKANGTGNGYSDEQTVNFSASTDLYAVWVDIDPSITVTPTTIDFGTVYTTNTTYVVKNVTIKNTGTVDVALSIKNPTSSGPFGSLNFELGKVLKPGEEYKARLAVTPSGSYHNVAGTYTGTYVISGTYVNDDAIKSSANVKGAVTVKKLDQSIKYTTHVQDIGWQTPVSDGAMAGTSGKSYRLEGIKIAIANKEYDGDIEYRTHVQDIGWQNYVKNGEMAGTSGKSYRLEAIQIRLTGDMANHYDVYYRVHAQDFGWMAWAKNDEMAGTAGYAYRLEGIEIVLVPKGENPPARSNQNYNKPFKDKNADPENTLVKYRTHVQDIGWQNYVFDGAMAGTSGKSYRLEGINIALTNKQYSGDIEYRTHVQNIGWQNYVKNGAMAGTSGLSYRLEAIQIRLTGEMAEHYDVYYRVHAQDFGWMGWAKNDEMAGTAGYAFRLEGIEIVLVPKGGNPPARSNQNYAAPFAQR